jgi:hypothetical protein
MIGYYPIMTAQQVKNTLPEINDNIPNELITQHVKIVQQMKIRPLLGYDYYEELEIQTSGNTSGSTLTAANQFILDEYLYMIISLHVQMRLVMGNTYQLENAGLRVRLSDVSDAAQIQDMTYYRTDLKNDIDFLINEMKKYIDANQSSYVTYTTRSDPRENTANENRRDYNYGFSLGKVENDCIKYGIGRRIY